MGVSPIKPEYPPLLTPGFHALSIEEIRERFVVAFPISLTRRGIMEGLTKVVERLNGGGVRGEIWLDGSFVTEKTDPKDVDMLIRIPSDLYDADERVRVAVDWASDEDRCESHNCDSYLWVEYMVGHPLFSESENDRKYWTHWFGTSRAGVAKGIAVVVLPAALP